MSKYFVLVLVILLMGMPFAFAHGNDTFDEARNLIDSGVSCDQLTDDQLEIIGESLMEQMHSGEAHKIMDKMMGGEGSEFLRGMHIHMARRGYCGKDIEMNMMSGGMIGGLNMMNNFGSGFMGGTMRYGLISWIVVIVIVVLLIVWITQLQRRSTPEYILKDRLAKGEIDEQEYKERLALLIK